MWAANAATTVVGSIASVIVSINFGFDAVFGLGFALYVVAATMAEGLDRSPATSATSA